MDLNQLKWEIRAGETYLTVSPEEAAHWRTQDIAYACLQAGYLNADLPRIAHVLKEGTGRAEYVGPWLQKIDPNRFEQIQVEKDDQCCLIAVQPQAYEDPCLTSREVDHILKRYNIRAGILLNAISAMIRDKVANKKVKVAERQEAIQGESAQIILKIHFTEANKPKLLLDGRVDFRNLEQIIQVKAGHLLAVKKPSKQGIDGLALDGAIIPALAGEDLSFEGGENTEIHNCELVAASDGYVYEDQDGHLAVGCLYVLDGDVNFRSGNIHYKGDVLIKGNVLPDFEVVASGGISIQGDVDGARIISGGNVVVVGGFFGKDKGLIRAKGSIDLRLAQDCEIESEQNVTFSVHLANCKIKAKSLASKTLAGILRNCQVQISESLSLGQIGAPAAGLSQVRIVYAKDEELKARILEAQKLMEESKLQSQTLLQRLQSMKNILKRAEEVSPRAAEELQKVFAEYQESQRREEAYQRKIEIIEKNRSDLSGFKGRVEVGTLFPPLQINMIDQELILKMPSSRMIYSWKEREIISDNLGLNWQPTIPQSNSAQKS